MSKSFTVRISSDEPTSRESSFRWYSPFYAKVAGKTALESEGALD